jgi:hypothetical protein
VQLVAFTVVPFAIYTLVPTILPTSEVTMKIIFHYRSFAVASISGIVLKRFPFIVSLIFGNSQKSQGAKSGKYGG